MTPENKAGPRPIYDVPFLESLTVDGDPAEWGDGGFRVRLAGVDDHEEKKLVSKDDIDVVLRLGWTHDGLGALLKVHDDEFVEDTYHDRLCRGNHLLEVTSRENREALAKGVLAAKEHYERAIEQIEEALAAEGEAEQ